jgi:hypothetical protein
MKAKAKQRKALQRAPEDMAMQFLENLMAFHADDLRYLGTEARDAVICKSVALVALAFDLPPTSADAVVNIEETASGLVHALNELRRLRLAIVDN